MNTFDTTCPQCTGDAIATPDQGRNMIFCPQCGYEGTMQQTQNIEQEKSNQTKLNT